MIRRLLRAVRRAPGRIVVSTLALALAVAAIGVFAIPTVAASSLREATASDGVANIVVGTTDTGTIGTSSDVADLVGSIDNVVDVDPQIIVDVPIAGARDRSVTVVGVDVGEQDINIVRADAGRLPGAPGEVIAASGSASIGDRIDVVTADGSTLALEVVGLGGTSFFEGEQVAFTGIETAARVGGLDGVNRLAVRTDDASADALRATSDEIRTTLDAVGVQLTYLPVTIENGIHPVEAEIEQVSMLIGMLGIVAGVVGLVLLASTTNTLITERSREVAVMRALGAPPRMLRRRLRRLAIGIAVAAVVLGVPLGIVISNVIARLVLEEFVGLTPDLAVSIPVMIGSAVFAIVGARIVAARAAWRVTRRPLAEALRDRDGRPFGRSRRERLIARSRAGGLLGRAAVRNAAHRSARSLAIAGQIGAAVAALLIVSSMATTINDFNDAEAEPWRWSSMTWVAGPGLDIDRSVVDGRRDAETAIEVEAEAREWQIDVYGFESGTTMVDRSVVDGAWFTEPGEAVVSAGFAEHLDLVIGDEIDVRLASGPATFEVSGTHANRGREIYVDRAELGSLLGDADGANRIFSTDDEPRFALSGVVGQERLDAIRGDSSGRTAILLIFGAIGVVVVAVAGLAVASGIVVNIHERRHELAALRAIGARRRDLVRLLATELLWLGVIGLGFGAVAGYAGAAAITRSFEVSNAVEIGFAFASGALPVVVGVVLVGLTTLAATMVRPAVRRPIAETLRGAA